MSLPVDPNGSDSHDATRRATTTTLEGKRVHKLHKKHLGPGFDSYGHHMHGDVENMGYNIPLTTGFGYPNVHHHGHPHHYHDNHGHQFNVIHHDYQFHAPDIDYWWPSHWPQFLPPPFPFHKDKDDKKKDDKKKEDKKKDEKKEDKKKDEKKESWKTKGRQLVFNAAQ
eukprot:gene12877-14203_t